ncbi:MAG: diguanylate cyclase [Sphingomonas sp.]
MAGLTQLPTLRQVLSRVHFRVTLFAVGISGLTVLLSGFAALGIYAQQNLALIAQTASYNVAPAVVFFDRDAAQQAIDPLAATKGVAAITVVMRNDIAFVERRMAGAHSDVSWIEWAADRLFFPEPAVSPIVHNGQTIGQVRVQGDATIIAGYIRTGLAGALACLIVTAIATWFLARKLQQSVVAPLQAIAAVAHAVRADRELGRRAPEARIREIESLRDDFNALLAELEQWHGHLRSENETLNHRATHDALTGLPNRCCFDEQLAAMLEQARRDGSSFAVLYADGDGFKGVNDQYGHAAGDAVLVAIADRLRIGLRARDMAARLGGDEFAILLAAPSGAEAVARVRETLHVQMAAPIALPGGARVTVGLSIGAAVFPRDGDDVGALVNHADIEMLASKPLHPVKRKGAL